MPFRVIVGPRARTDIRDAVNWMARVDVMAASRWRESLLAVVLDLENDPLRYSVADEAAELGIELRVRLFGRRRNIYRVLFVVDGETVNVLRVRHASRDQLAGDDL